MSSYRVIVDADRCSDFSALGSPSFIKPMNLAVFRAVDGIPTEDLRQQVLSVNTDGYTCIALPERAWKAVFFDMDSTVIAEESIVELSRVAGLEAEVRAITEQAMAGLLDFEQALRQRVKMLAGMSARVLEDIGRRLTINPGMREFAERAKERSIELYLVSGGFNSLAGKIVADLGFHGFEANELEIKTEQLTGQLLGTIVDSQGKARYLDKICKQRGFSLSEVVAVGDGANDLPMLQRAGAAIGFRPKPVLLSHINGANLHDHRVLVHALL